MKSGKRKLEFDFTDQENNNNKRQRVDNSVSKKKERKTERKKPAKKLRKKDAKNNSFESPHSQRVVLSANNILFNRSSEIDNSKSYSQGKQFIN